MYFIMQILMLQVVDSAYQLKVGTSSRWMQSLPSLPSLLITLPPLFLTRPLILVRQLALLILDHTALIHQPSPIVSSLFVFPTGFSIPHTRTTAHGFFARVRDFRSRVWMRRVGARGTSLFERSLRGGGGFTRFVEFGEGFGREGVYDSGAGTIRRVLRVGGVSLGECIGRLARWGAFGVGWKG